MLHVYESQVWNKFVAMAMPLLAFYVRLASSVLYSRCIYKLNNMNIPIIYWIYTQILLFRVSFAHK